MNSSGNNRHDDRQLKPFEQRARELWCEAARQVDPGTAARLRAARRQALQRSAQPAPAGGTLADPHRRLRRPSRWPR